MDTTQIARIQNFLVPKKIFVNVDRSYCVGFFVSSDLRTTLNCKARKVVESYSKCFRDMANKLNQA